MRHSAKETQRKVTHFTIIIIFSIHRSFLNFSQHLLRHKAELLLLAVLPDCKRSTQLPQFTKLPRSGQMPDGLLLCIYTHLHLPVHEQIPDRSLLSGYP